MGDWDFINEHMGGWNEDTCLPNFMNGEVYRSNKYNSSATRCPKCKSKMIKRLAKQGKYKGKYFYGCSRFPRCKGIVSID
jgi:ssDNA-binding Zn-finger/Zn-ribbon topoisomerase 1